MVFVQLAIRACRPGAKRAIALVVVVLFCFQLSRFYLIIQLDPVECFDPNHTHHTTSTGAHDHHHDGEETLPHSHDDGFFFQHCKDTFDGAGLTPVQPLGVPVAVSDRQPETTWASSMPESRRPHENFLPLPFQPPRNLS